MSTVHEGNLADAARETRIREWNIRSGYPDHACTCDRCFLLRRLDDARAQLDRARCPEPCAWCDAHRPACRVCRGLGFIGQLPATEPCIACDGTGNPPPNLSEPVRSSAPSRPRENGPCEHGKTVCACYGDEEYLHA